MNESERLLKFAVDEIIVNMNHHKLSAQEAVTKVARELDLNTHMIKRSAEVINVALHQNHLKKSASKADDFPIVDAVKVASDIFGAKEKTAAEIRSELFPSNDFDEQIPDINKYLNNPRWKAAHEQILNSPEKNTSFPLSDKGIYEKSANYIRNLEKQLDEVKTKLAGAKFEYNNKFCSVLDKFARDSAYRSSFGEFESQVYSMHGDRSIPYIDLLYKNASIVDERGAHDSNYKLFDTCKEAQIFDEFIKAAKEYNQLEDDVKIAEYNLKFEKDYVASIYSERGRQLFDKKSEMSIMDQINAEDKTAEFYDPVQAIANLKIAAMAKEAADKPKGGGGFSPPGFHFLKEKVKDESTPGSDVPTVKPDDNLDRKLMLQELATTDPILSSADPHKLLGAYEQMLHISPEMSKEKEVVRSVLRSMVSTQALGTHEAQQMIDANTSLFQQKMMQEGRFAKPVGPPQVGGK